MAGMVEAEQRKKEDELARLDEDGTTIGAGPDHFALHFERTLTEQEVAVLAGAAPKLHDVDIPGLDVWESARWQRDREGSGGLESLPESVDHAHVKASACWGAEGLACWGAEGLACWASPGREGLCRLVVILAEKESTASRLQERLKGRWRDTHSGSAAFESPRQRALFSVLSTYGDVLLPAQPYARQALPLDPPSDPEVLRPRLEPLAFVSIDSLLARGDPYGPDEVTDAWLLHILNHCAKVSDRIKKNNAIAERIREERSGEDLPRDQGFARPKALVLLPMRNRALGVVRRLIDLAIRESRKDSVQRKEKFVNDFAGEGSEDEEELDERGKKRRVVTKPDDHKTLFSGNLDDHFRVGVKITRGAVRLYSDLEDSDILVCSPLGLVTKIEEGRKQRNSGALDFLSSIEIVVIDRADVIQMQNWNHVGACLDALNQLPEQQGKVDIMRVREWYLSGLARHYRQTVLVSSFASAEMAALFGRHCANHAGRWRLRAEPAGVLGSIVAQVRQLFERVHVSGLESAADDRFGYFVKSVWPRIKESGAKGQLLFIPSYFDFVRVRNFLTVG